jgi:hypothetical protein
VRLPKVVHELGIVLALPESFRQQLEGARVELAAIIEYPENFREFRIARIGLDCPQSKIVRLGGINIRREVGIKQDQLPDRRRMERIIRNDLLVGVDRLIELSVGLLDRCKARQRGRVVRVRPQILVKLNAYAGVVRARLDRK